MSPETGAGIGPPRPSTSEKRGHRPKGVERVKKIMEWLVARLVGLNRLERLAAAMEGSEDY